MELYSLNNPVFVVYAITASIMVLKIMGQGWMTVYRMLKSDSGLVSPEDLQAGLINRNPRAEQLELNDYVDRSRRMHRNDLENIPAFWMAGLLFVTTAPPLWLAQVGFYGFAAARLAHGLAYGTGQSHELRATFYTIGTLLTAYMIVHVVVVVIV